MANEFTREPQDGGDIGVWGPFELAQNRSSLGANTVKLYNDSGTLKMKVGKIGLDNESKKGVASYDAISTISIAGVSTSNWAKIELTVSGTTPTLTASDISGATDPNVIPADFKNAYDGEKGGYYISATARTIGIVYKDSGDALANIINTKSIIEGFYGADDNVNSTGGGWFPSVPIGAMIPWHKSLTGVPDLPECWAECDGSVVTDVESTLFGQTLPDSNGDEVFLRGGSVSGVSQLDALQGHRHKFNSPQGNDATAVDYSTNQESGTADRDRITKGGDTAAANDFFITDPVTDGVNGTPRTADETRPVNMSVVWIMRIK